MRRVPFEADEKESLYVALDRHRDVVLGSSTGSTTATASAMMPSGTSLLGLVKHLAAIEYGWFCHTFGRPMEPPPFDLDDPDADLRIGRMSRPPASSRSTPGPGQRPTGDRGAGHRAPRHLVSGKTVTLRWVLIHMIEETARHAGHLDILRELTDGATGDFPPD